MQPCSVVSGDVYQLSCVNCPHILQVGFHHFLCNISGWNFNCIHQNYIEQRQYLPTFNVIILRISPALRFTGTTKERDLSVHCVFDVLKYKKCCQQFPALKEFLWKKRTDHSLKCNSEIFQHFHGTFILFHCRFQPFFSHFV